MDLVVAREDIALWIDQKRAVCGAVGRDPDRKRANMHVNAELTRNLTQRRQRCIGPFFDDHCEKLFTIGGQDVCHFGSEHIFGAGRFCVADVADSGIDIDARLETRAHLDHGCFESAAVHGEALPLANSGSSLPARSSVCSSSLPPTCVVPIKICGTVMRPLAR